MLKGLDITVPSLDGDDWLWVLYFKRTNANTLLTSITSRKEFQCVTLLSAHLQQIILLFLLSACCLGSSSAFLCQKKNYFELCIILLFFTYIHCV